jgi:hypothetical protein
VVCQHVTRTDYSIRTSRGFFRCSNHLLGGGGVIVILVEVFVPSRKYSFMVTHMLGLLNKALLT